MFRLGHVRQMAALVLLTVLAACYLPRDPERTTETVTGQTLKVGVLTRELEGADAEAVRRIAAALEATPELAQGDPHGLFTRLENGGIHLIAGRLPEDTPFAADVALSRPIGQMALDAERKKRVLAVRQGENRFLVTVNRAIEGMEQ